MKSNKYIKPTTRVYRKQIIEGYSIPAIIKNSSYFFTDLDVYENGRVSCWNFEDFEHFKNDVDRGWIALSIPDNETISIHGLGDWIITNGNWIFNKETFVIYVEELIKELNPKLENLFQYSEKVINGVRVGESGNGTVFKELKRYPNDIFPKKLKGESINLFYKVQESYYLVKVNVFADSTIQLSRLENPVDLTTLEFEKLVKEKIIITKIPVSAKVIIHGLGDFEIISNEFHTNIKNKVLEIKDILRELNGQPSTIDVCREAHSSYIENPTIENKEKLKASYEKIPDHQRMYVGDMDVKDIEVRMIIYGEHEIENWSHYQVAKSQGKALPVIKIAKPKD